MTSPEVGFQLRENGLIRQIRRYDFVRVGTAENGDRSLSIRLNDGTAADVFLRACEARHLAALLALPAGSHDDAPPAGTLSPEHDEVSA